MSGLNILVNVINKAGVIPADKCVVRNVQYCDTINIALIHKKQT